MSERCDLVKIIGLEAVEEIEKIEARWDAKGESDCGGRG